MIVQVQPLKTTRYGVPSKVLTYRSGKIAESRLRDGAIVVIDILGWPRLGKVVEVARTRAGLHGRVYTGTLKTIDRLANPAELAALVKIMDARASQERARKKLDKAVDALTELLKAA